MHLIERDKELVLLDRLAAQSFAGQGQVVLLTGAPATGRTTLQQACAERLTRHGALVLHAGCARLERSLPGGVISQLLHSAPLPEPFDEPIAALLEAATARATDHDDSLPDTELLRLFDQLCVHLRRLAAARPLLVAIDDIDHADDTSLQFLQQLVRRVRTAPILVVLTDDERYGSASPFLVELHRQPHLHHIPVTPLSREGVRELLHQRTDEADAARLTCEFYDATGGNPLLLDALIQQTHETAPRSDRYGPAFLSCLHRSDPLLLDVARALAILGDGVKRVSPRHLVNAEAKAVERAQYTMAAAGLLLAGTFRHAAARKAVLEHIPGESRSLLHRRAAHLLFDSGAPASTVAAHLLAGGRKPLAWAAPVLVEAAEQDRATGQKTRAAQYLELALQAHTEPQEIASVRARLSRIEWEIDPALATRHFAALLTALRQDVLDRRDALVLVRQLLWHGRTEEALAALNLVRGNAERHPEAGAELRDLELWLAYAHPPLARRRAPGGSDVTSVAPMADPWLHSTATMANALIRGQVGEAVDRAEQALRDLELGRHTDWADETALIAFVSLTRGDRLHVVADWSPRLGERAGRTASASWQAVLALTRSDIALGLGDSAAAVDHARSALVELAPKAWGIAVGLPLANLILAYSRLGRFDDANAQLTLPVQDSMFQSRYGLSYLYARGHYHLAIRHHHAALADFLSCGELVRGWGLDAANPVQWRAGAAEAWLRLGNGDQARRLASDELTRAGSGDARGRGTILRVLAAAGPVSRRPQLLTESLELLEDCGDQYEQARTLGDLATAHHALGQNRKARVVFQRALHVAKVSGAELLHHELLSVSSELGETFTANGDADRLADLTESERRVAALAVMGYTNREIAAKLYITASTVEQHLTRVYRKLKVSHRRELPSELSWRRASRPRASAS
ncbi:AAA family ATPase [Micromonospora sp. NPDC050397]|uniref:helix-turn-helix transcriptional regulator n=1 Tax=Micromonospora sp. NPDC050397 TaxID=3364279 RepID=UPI003850CD5C